MYARYSYPSNSERSDLGRVTDMEGNVSRGQTHSSSPDFGIPYIRLYCLTELPYLAE